MMLEIALTEQEAAALHAACEKADLDEQEFVRLAIVRAVKVIMADAGGVIEKPWGDK